jgi:hypothetical protein
MNKEAMMLNVTSRGMAIGVWFAIVAVVAAITTVLLGAVMTTGTGLLLLAACFVPPGIMLMVWRGAPPATIAEVLHEADRRTQQ